MSWTDMQSFTHTQTHPYTHARCPTMTLPHRAHTSYTQCLRQPDVRRISEAGSQHRAPYPLELIHFTTLPLPLCLTFNLCLHLHLTISLSLILFFPPLSSLLSPLPLISVVAPTHLLSLLPSSVASSGCRSAWSALSGRWSHLGRSAVPLVVKDPGLIIV